MRQFTRSRAIAFLLILTFLTPIASAAVYSFDFGAQTDAVQAGFTPIWADLHDWTGLTYGSHGPPFDLGGGVQAAVMNGYNGNVRVRAGAFEMAGFGLDTLMTGFLVVGDIDKANYGFMIKGIPDGAYTVTVYSWDGEYHPDRTYSWKVDWASGSADANFGPGNQTPLSIDNGRGSAVATLTSGPSANQIEVYPNGPIPTGDFWALNGIVIAPVPEPAALSLLLLTIPLCLRRR